MNRLLLFDGVPAIARVPLKWAVFVVIVVMVCFPFPGRLASHVRHWRDPNALLDPSAEALQPLVAEIREQVSAEMEPKEKLRRVQNFVLRKVPYGWDWDTWGMADYLPTVAEVLEAGREDCDGRAVVAASLLRALGEEATIVTDFSHVWVRTPQGDLMGPGKADAVVATKDGPALRLKGLLQIPNALAYGVAVFPWGRELIILVAAWWLMLRRGTGFGRALIGLRFLVLALLFLRIGGENWLHPKSAIQALGALHLIVGVAVLLLWRRKSRDAGAQLTQTDRFSQKSLSARRAHPGAPG